MRYMALKLPKYFYLLMEKSLGCHFQVKSPYYKPAQCNQKTWTPVSSRWKVRSKKVIKGWASTRITATTSAHLPKPASTDLTIKSDSALTNPTKKWGVKLVEIILAKDHSPSLLVIQNLDLWAIMKLSKSFDLITEQIFLEPTTKGKLAQKMDFQPTSKSMDGWCVGVF